MKKDKTQNEFILIKKYSNRRLYNSSKSKYINFKELYQKTNIDFIVVTSDIKNIDLLGIDGNFIESQAFAYLAIRSFLKLPISYPSTTGCKSPCSGGVIVKNF